MKHVGVLTIGAWLLLAVLATGQEGEKRTFVKITHSGDRTVAIDSTGKVWYFDAETEQFIPAEDYDEIDTDDYSSEDSVLAGTRHTRISRGDVFELFDSYVVEYDQCLDGSIVCLHDVRIDGLVTKDVVSLKTVTISPTGEVRGDVVAREIIRERGGRIHGQRERVQVGIDLPEVPRTPRILQKAVSLLVALFLFFLAVVITAMVPKPISRISVRLGEQTVKSFFWGLLVWLALLPVFILLIITIIGIPIAILVYPFVLLATFLVAFTTGIILTGRITCRFLHWKTDSLYLQCLCGAVLLMASLVCAGLFSALGLFPLGNIIHALFWIIAFVIFTAGLGATVTSRFGFERRAKQPPAPGIVEVTPPPSPVVRPPSPASGSAPSRTPVD